MKKKFTTVFAFICICLNVLNAQSLAVNNDGSTADASAILDVKSLTKGLLIPRVSTTGSVTSPATGLLVYVTTGTVGFYYNAGTPGTPSWKQLLPADGNGSALTNLPAASLTGTLPAISGTNLTSLNASNLGSGTVPTARLGTGTASATTFLRGDGTWNTPSGSASLPTQTGNSGKVLTTDGTNANWNFPVASTTQLPNAFYPHQTSTTSATYISPFQLNGFQVSSGLVANACFLAPANAIFTMKYSSFIAESVNVSLFEVTPASGTNIFSENGGALTSITLAASSGGVATTGTLSYSITAGKIYVLKMAQTTAVGSYYTASSFN